LGCCRFFKRIPERDTEIVAGAEVRRVCFGFFRQRVSPLGGPEVGFRCLLPHFPILKLVEPGVRVRHFHACPEAPRAIDEVSIPRNVALPTEATRHRAASDVLRIVERGQARVRDAPGGCCGAVEAVRGHHVDENPGHAEVRRLGFKERLERPTGAPHTQRSGRRLNRHDARTGGLIVEPLAERFDPVGEAPDPDHAAALVPQARQATAQARAAVIASLQHASLSHLAQQSANASQVSA